MTSTGERRPVVLGVDALAVNPTVVAWAADEADRRGVPLRLVHAVPEERRGEGKRRHGSSSESGGAALDQIVELVRGRVAGLKTVPVVADGSPARVLCRESTQAELLVLGSRGMSRLEEILSGYSVTVPVSAQARCPVVVVRDPEPPADGRPWVVVGVDGSPSSVTAVQFAAEFAARRGAALRAAWVWQVPLIVPFDEKVAMEELRRQLHVATAGCAEQFPDLELEREVLRGHPVEELARVSEGALAVVVGRRGHGGFTGMRLGSVPHGLLHRAHCPVVTVPPPAEAEG
ncbi:universal stress protein [Kitasatospora cinereorecta]|uniref:Universal stress protein n=1 Tax=Kitasatospora cinereorecta TaxID=285560 RepID=A0ABW0VFQ2_9ACTN